MIPWERMTPREQLDFLDRKRDEILYNAQRERYSQKNLTDRTYYPEKSFQSEKLHSSQALLPAEIAELTFVNSVDEAVNKLPDYEGRLKIFINTKDAEIYTNEVNKKTGAKDFLVWRPVLTEPPAAPETPADNSISIVVSLAQEIDSKLNNICRELGIVKEEMKNVKSANNPISSSTTGTEVPGSSPGHSNSAQTIPSISEQKP